MANAALDQSGKQTTTARLKTDGLTRIRLTANPTTGILDVSTDTSGAVVPSSFAATDDNGRVSMFAVSENDQTQLVALQCDSTGALLIKEI